MEAELELNFSFYMPASPGLSPKLRMGCPWSYRKHPKKHYLPTGVGLIATLRPLPSTALFEQMCTECATEGRGLTLFYNSDLFQGDLR